MGNPFVHILVFIAAVLIPGGLLAYFAWRALSCRNQPNSDIIIDIPEPHVAREAFERMFPVGSRCTDNRQEKLRLARAIRHRNFKN